MSALQGSLAELLGLPNQSWKAWKEVSLLSAFLMELSWIAPWLHVFLKEQGASQLAVIQGLALVGLMSFVLMRATSAFSLNRTARLLGSFGLLVVVFPGVLSRILFPLEKLGYFSALSRTVGAISSAETLFPSEFLVILSIIFVWLRAIRWASSDALPSEVLGRFKLGFLIHILYVFIFTWSGRGDLGAFTIVFFFTGWMALGSARLARAAIHPAAGRDFFSLNWLLIFLAGLVIVASILALFGIGLHAQFALVQQIFLSIWLSLWGLIILLLSPFIIAIAWVFEYVLGRLNQTALASFLQSNQADTTEETVEELTSASPPPFLQSLIDWLNSLQITEWVMAMRPLLLWGIIGAMVLIGLYYAGRRTNFWKAVSDDVHLDIEIEEGDEWWRSLAASWRRRLFDLRNSLARFADPNIGRKLLAAARIRRVYSFLMDLSADLGQARREAQTPLEYIPALNHLFPHHAKDVEIISQAYMRVRYGELDETPFDVIEVDRAWLQLRQEGEHIKRKRKKEKLEAKKAES
jgi:hypothetical protein